MKEEIMEDIKNLKEQGINVRVDEDRINDLINKIFNKKDEKNKYIDFEMKIKIYILDMTKIKINLIQKKLLNHLKNYVIN